MYYRLLSTGRHHGTIWQLFGPGSSEDGWLVIPIRADGWWGKSDRVVESNPVESNLVESNPVESNPVDCRNLYVLLMNRTMDARWIYPWRETGNWIISRGNIIPVKRNHLMARWWSEGGEPMNGPGNNNNNNINDDYGDESGRTCEMADWLGMI